MTVAAPAYFSFPVMKDTIRPSILLMSVMFIMINLRHRILEALVVFRLNGVRTSALVFSFAKAVRKKDGDRLSVFQFTMSIVFNIL